MKSISILHHHHPCRVFNVNVCTLKHAVIVIPHRITSGSFDPEVVSSELKLEDPELNVSRYKLGHSEFTFSISCVHS